MGKSLGTYGNQIFIVGVIQHRFPGVTELLQCLPINLFVYLLVVFILSLKTRDSEVL